MNLIKVLSIIFIAICSLSLDQTTETVLCAGFFPANNLNIPVAKASNRFDNIEIASGMTESEFNSVIDVIENLYKEEVSAKGGTLMVNRSWENGTVNAYAMRNREEWHLVIYGGLARLKKMTPDAFALILCHEIGHHVGGAIKGNDIDAMTIEGSADYFAVTKCVRKYFALDGGSEISIGKLDESLVKSCQNTFSSESDRAICKRTLLSGETLALILFEVTKNTPEPPRYSTPETVEVAATNPVHPNAQCRLDTYLHGALCSVDKEVAVDDENPSIGTCTMPKYVEGLRPRCWFKPEE